MGKTLAPATAALGAMMWEATRTGDQFHKMAIRTGESAEELSALAHAADLSGSNIATVEKGLRYIQAAAVDFTRGIGEAKNAFEELGITVTNADGSMKGSVEMMTDVANALQGVDDETRKAALAMDIFGMRAGPQMLPLLQQGGAGIRDMMDEAKRLGIAINDEFAADAAAFNDQMSRLKGSFIGAARSIIGDLYPAITKIATAITNMSAGTKRAIAVTVAFAGVIGPMLISLGLMATTLSALLSPVTLVVAAFAGLVAAGVLVYRNFHRTGKNLANLWQQIKERILTPVADIAKGLWNWLVVALDKIRAKVWEIIEKIAEPFVWLYNKIVDLFGGEAIDGFIIGATSAITGGLAGSVAAAANVIDILADQTSGFFSDLGADARDAVTDVQAAFARLQGFLNGTAANIPAAQGLIPVQRAANGMEYLPEIDYDGIDEGITAIDESLARTTESVQGFGNYFQNTFEQMANSYNDLAGAATRWARWTIIQMSAVIAKAIVLQGIPRARHLLVVQL